MVPLRCVEWIEIDKKGLGGLATIKLPRQQLLRAYKLLSFVYKKG